MILTYLAIIVVLFFLYIKWKKNYWKRRGVQTTEAQFFFGTLFRFLKREKAAGQFHRENYRIMKKKGLKYYGDYLFMKPALTVLDLSLIKQIVIKDFGYFMGHGAYTHPKDTLTQNLFNLEGEKWRDLRVKLTPTFTSGKMKMMFDTLVDKTKGLEKVVSNYAQNKEPFTIKDVLGRYTTDIIGSCAFGIECNSLDDPDNEFRQYGKKVFKLSFWRLIIQGIVPRILLGYTGFKSAGTDVTNFFTKVVMDTIKSREGDETLRKDFMHLLLQLKKYGSVDNETNGKRHVTDDDIIAQCFIFFLAGFETSSTTMTFALLELAQHQDIQEKLRQEINAVLAKHDGRITYESVMEMHYLEQVINETLRMYPPVLILPRTCTKNYKIPGTDVVIGKGTSVRIPVWGIHTDPEYYPRPEEFDPERFNPKNVKSRPDFTFLPFGEGPRMCIGLRFGMMQSKVGLVFLLKKFRFDLNSKTPTPIEMDPNSFILSVKGEVWLNATKL